MFRDVDELDRHFSFLCLVCGEDYLTESTYTEGFSHFEIVQYGTVIEVVTFIDHTK